jgi:hypothetical protein
MIGQAIEAHRPFPKASVFLFLIALVLAVLSVIAGTVHWAVAGVLPLMWGITLWVFRDPSFSGQLTETALELLAPPVTIPYEKLQGLWAKGRTGNPTRPKRRSFPMQIAHEDGILYIPANLNLSSEDLYQFMYSRFSPSGSREVNSQLAKYLAVEEGAFGSDRVWSFRARKHLARPFGARKFRAFSLAIVLSALLWLGLGFGPNKLEGWIAGGFIGLFIGLVLFLGSFIVTQTGPQRIKRWQQSSLIISPGGIAMIQGETKGEMGWDELLDVKWREVKNQAFTSDSDPPGIVLVFEGAKVSIADIYDRPLPIIYRHIAQCWREPPSDT